MILFPLLGRINQTLEKNKDIFTLEGVPTPFAEHRIETADHAPIAVPLYRLSAPKKEILKMELDEMMSSKHVNHHGPHQ